MRNTSIAGTCQEDRAASLVAGTRSSHEAGAQVVASGQMATITRELIVSDSLIEMAVLCLSHREVVTRFAVLQTAPAI